MKTTFRNKIQKFIAGLLVLSVGLLIVNNVVFMHAHKLSNGKIIVHAHPYNKSQDSAPFKKHNHTSKELFHISHIHLLFVGTLFFIFGILQLRHKNVYLYNSPLIRFNYYFNLKGREPPVINNSFLL